MLVTSRDAVAVLIGPRKGILYHAGWHWRIFLRLLKTCEKTAYICWYSKGACSSPCYFLYIKFRGSTRTLRLLYSVRKSKFSANVGVRRECHGLVAYLSRKLGSRERSANFEGTEGVSWPCRVPLQEPSLRYSDTLFANKGSEYVGGTGGTTAAFSRASRGS